LKYLPVEPYADIVARSIILAHLYGRNDMNETMVQIKAKSFQGEEIPTAYDAAVKFFLAKNIITKDQFDLLEKRARKYAFTVAKVDSERALEAIKTSLDDALSLGLPMAEWLNNVDSVLMNSGMHALNDFHLKTVFRNNMQTALNEGSMEMMKQADISEFPLWQYVAILDGRERPSHKENHGFTAPANDPVWQVLQPPLDHNCRCRIRPVHTSEGLKSSSGKPVVNPDEMKFVTPEKVKKAKKAAAAKKVAAVKKSAAKITDPKMVREEIRKTHLAEMKKIVKMENKQEEYKKLWSVCQ